MPPYESPTRCLHCAKFVDIDEYDTWIELIDDVFYYFCSRACLLIQMEEPEIIY